MTPKEEVDSEVSQQAKAFVDARVEQLSRQEMNGHPIPEMVYSSDGSGWQDTEIPEADLAERFDVTPHIKTNDFVAWFFCQALVNGKADGEKLVQKLDPNGKRVFDVVFRVNGVDLPFVDTLSDLEEGFRSQVETRAKELVESRLAKSFEKVDEFCANLETEFKKQVQS